MEPHKRYLLFMYSDYYPAGGISDLFGSYDTIEEAIEEANKDCYDYKELYDRVEGKLIEIDDKWIS